VVPRARAARDIARHFVATTTNVQAAAAFGIHDDLRLLGLGGRPLLAVERHRPAASRSPSAPTLPRAAGRRARDGPPLRRGAAGAQPAGAAGLLDVWYRNFHRFTSRSVAPYHQGLARLPAYLQQLEMESNGKCVDHGGEPLPYGTSPVVWGEPGTNGQHAYFQMLHQGTDVVPVEFIAVRQPAHGHLDLHHKLLANCLAQSQALMLGKTADSGPAGTSAPRPRQTCRPRCWRAHRSFPGNRPSTTLVLER
jgi:glucose-6-phosphate isomerase